MASISPTWEQIGAIRYGKVESEIYWLKNNNATIEILGLSNDVYLIRGAKNYYVTDVYDPEEFHSKLQEIGVFSDYLKESVPSFSLSYYYISSLTEGIIGVDSSPIRAEIGELKRSILHKQKKLATMESEKKLLNLPVGREAISIEAEIKHKSERLQKLEEEEKRTEQFKREYGSKGFGTSIVIKSQTSCYSSRKAELEEKVGLMIEDLENFDNVIKNRAKQGFHLVIKELPNPALAYSTESLGLFDPQTLDDLIIKYPELAELKNQVEETFVHRWAKEARIGERTFDKSSAIAQGLATLLRRATSKAQLETKIKEPKWDRLPFPDETKRQGFLGFVLDGYLEATKFPLLFDYDNQAPTHTLIVGASGFGKTITAYDIAEGALFQDIPVLVLDPMIQWSGFLEKCDEKKLLDRYKEFQMIEPMSFRCRVLTPSSDVGANLNTNLLAKPRTGKENELQAFAIDLSLIIKDFCKLSDNETVKLKDTVFSSWKKGLDLDYSSLINETDKEFLKMKLQSLAALSFLFEGKGLSDISSLWKSGEVYVISLNEIKVEQVKMFAAYYFIRELISYFDSQPDSNTLKLLFVVEEAHRFKGSVKAILDRAARTLRKKGVGIVFVTQTITDLEETRANTAMKIYMHMTYDNDIERAKIDLGNDFAKLLPSLETGFGICAYPTFDVPVIVKFRPCYHKSTGLTSEEIKNKMMMWQEKDLSKFYKEEQKEIPQEVSKVMQVLNEIIAYHKETGKPPRREDIMKRLGWKSDRMINEIKNQLIKDGKIKEEQDPEDKRAKRLVPI